MFELVALVGIALTLSRSRRPMPAPHRSPIVLVTGGHRHVFRYARGDEPHVVAELFEMAVERPDLAFDRLDARLVASRMGPAWLASLDDLLSFSAATGGGQD